jgi:carbon storage regulator
MLVLGRYRNQHIRIGENVWVTICGHKDGQVQIGITAPRDVEVVRDELLPENKRFRTVKNVSKNSTDETNSAGGSEAAGG